MSNMHNLELESNDEFIYDDDLEVDFESTFDWFFNTDEDRDGE